MGFVKKIIGNIYVKNLLIMVILLTVIIAGVLIWLNAYTKHNESVTVPVLKGLQVEEVAAILNSSNLNYEVVDSIYEKRGVPGSVLEQVPKENSKVKEDRTIYLIVQAKSEQLVKMPNLEDLSQRQAVALLNALGFTKIHIKEVPSEYRDLVMGAEFKGRPLVAGQEIPKGSVLNLKVGAGGLESSDENDSDSIHVDSE
ncbi:PASTA domain-containing protein [Dysgonomonas sp. 216]|uniref:PASTA domain-containing protein n=1 Tax=Dysgonomonas sp. 216 TaxID=2302934 RepID=UPI0013D7D11B|nr:PASTA domain-containing protein [Dysgonomonas sp. 216]NDW17470.1 PASTA domain-containing protein [Dysgonomonas sp. 216]